MRKKSGGDDRQLKFDLCNTTLRKSAPPQKSSDANRDGDAKLEKKKKRQLLLSAGLTLMAVIRLICDHWDKIKWP